MKENWKHLGVYFNNVTHGIRAAHAIREISNLVTTLWMCKHSMTNLEDFAQDIAEIVDECKNSGL